jgi:hypothetical protein
MACDTPIIVLSVLSSIWREGDVMPAPCQREDSLAMKTLASNRCYLSLGTFAMFYDSIFI